MTQLFAIALVSIWSLLFAAGQIHAKVQGAVAKVERTWCDAKKYLVVELKVVISPAQQNVSDDAVSVAQPSSDEIANKNDSNNNPFDIHHSFDIDISNDIKQGK
ncbi:MAG: hypothetical protein R3C03_23085 [Pirellulaceae bacterium]